MPLLLKASWLIPVIPIVGAILIGALLVSFNRTINRLTKPISAFLIICVSASTLLSLVFFLNKVEAHPYDWNFTLASSNLHIGIILNLFIEKLLLIVGFSVVISMILSYNFLERRKGYVRYFIFLSASSGLTFFFVLNNILPV